MKKFAIISFIALIGLISIQSCEKSTVEPVKEVPKILVKAQSVPGMTLQEQFLVQQVNAWIDQKTAQHNSNVDAEPQLIYKGISYSPIPANWILPPTPIASSWWYPSVTVGIPWGDTLYLAAVNCIINSDTTFTFNGISLETAFPMINWTNYIKAWAVFDHQVLFCAASITPQMQTSQYQRHLFLVNSSGTGNIWWGRNEEDEVISEDGSVMLTNYYFE